MVETILRPGHTLGEGPETTGESKTPDGRTINPDGTVTNADGTVEEYNLDNIIQPQLPPGTIYDPALQQAVTNELLGNTQTTNPNVSATPTTVQGADTAAEVAQPDTVTVNATTVDPNAAQVDAAQGTVSDASQVQAAQGGASDAFLQSLDSTINQDVTFDPRSLVQTQYTTLMDFEAGEIPGWAAGAVRTARQLMSRRGVGGSTMAGEAITMALMQAALPIAQQDARVFEGLMHKKLDQKQQAVLLKAGHLANLDISNLNNRQQAAVVNAQHFMQMDLANLSNEQQAVIFNGQSKQQFMLSNQAAENAASQFNATSENQLNQFFAQLQAQIRTFNAAQSNDIRKFNAGELNAISLFNAEMRDARDRFNTEMRFAIEQSNVQYLRDINTANTAVQNQANYVNATNLLNISNTAMANEITLLRDREGYVFTASENQLNRLENRFLAALQQDFFLERLDEEQSNATATSFGLLASDIIGNIVGGIFDDDEDET